MIYYALNTCARDVHKDLIDFLAEYFSFRYMFSTNEYVWSEKDAYSTVTRNLPELLIHKLILQRLLREIA